VLVTETQTVDLAAWLTRVWDEEEAREREQTYIEFTSAFEQVNYKGNPLTLARIAADRKILEEHTRWDGRCDTCYISAWIDYGEPMVEHHPSWCPTARLLASPYKGREGWQEAWG
jgi:hypothetical protein